MRRSSIISLGLAVLFSLFLTDAPADDEQVDASSVEAKVASLIEQLANQNPEPKARGTRILRPEGYDREKDKAASSARSKLYRIGPDAFPQLIEHWGDKRYHISAHDGLSGAAKIISVGRACRELVDSQLQPFGFWPAKTSRAGGIKRPTYPGAFLDTTQQAKKWWRAHKDKSLCELQIMVVTWVIEQEEANAKDYSDAEREKLRSILEQLEETGEPILRGNYSAIDYS